MGTPNVIFNLLYAQPYKPGTPKNDRTQWRDWVSGDLFRYATRSEAVEKETIEDIKLIKSLCENTEIDEDDAKSILDSGFSDYFDYASNRPGSTGAFDAEGDISPERAAEIKKTLKNTQSIIWTGILSFEEEYGKKFCDDKAAAYAMMTEAFPALFSCSHLKYSNIDWYATLHRNTDNRHLHITFWERNPTFLRKGDTEYHYANVAKIKQEACVNFKFTVAKHFEIESMSSYKLRDSIRENLRRNINTVEKKDILLELLEGVKKNNSWQFGKQDSETKNKILQFALGVVDRNYTLKIQYDNYVKELMDRQEQYYKLCRENNLPVNDAIKNFVDKNLHDLHTRLGNDVITTLKYFDKEYQRIQRKYNSRNLRAENIKKLTSEDKELLEKIYSKPVGEKFKDLFEGHYTTDNTVKEKHYYHTENAAILAFATLLSSYTQDKEQFQRILCVSGVYSMDFDEEYEGQLDWIASEEDKRGAETFKDVIYSIAIRQYNRITALPTYDNSHEIQQLQQDDLKIIEKIRQSKLAPKYEKIMSSSWNSTQHDTSNELKNFHFHCYLLTDIIAKFTQNEEQIDRIFKASPLYRPEIWETRYANQIPFIAASDKNDAYGETIKKYCIDKSLKWKKEWQEKYTKKSSQRKLGNRILAAAHQSGRAVGSIIQNAFTMLNTSFDNSFNLFRNAIKEQERRRKQAEGGNPYNE